MQLITAPITRKTRGVAVTNLQDGLLLLLNRQFFHQIAGSSTQSFMAGLRREQTGQIYGDATSQLISIFQDQVRLTVTNIVDTSTAEALNKVLKDVGGLDQAVQFIVQGRVLRNDDPILGTAAQSTPVSNVLVQAFNTTAQSEDLLGNNTTNADGYYTITYTVTQGSGVNLIVRVYNPQGQAIATSDVKSNAQPQETINLTLNAAPAVPPPDVFVVKGTIRQEEGKFYGGAVVRAFDKDLRSEELLGEKVSNRNGDYEITYTAAQFQRTEKGSADLIVRVFNANRELQATSPIIFNAKSVEVVDLTVISPDSKRSEYERLMIALRPLLGELAIANLREDPQENQAEGSYQDLSFLSGETNLAKNILARLVMAYKLAQQAIQPEFWYALLGSSFYQYNQTQNLDEQFTLISGTLPSLDATAVNKALTRSFNQNEIPANLQQNEAVWVEAFLQFIAKQTVADSVKPTFVKLVLVDAGIQGSEKQEKFARLYNQYKNITPELLAALQQDSSFTQDEIDNLHTSFQLSDLTQGNFSVVKAVKDGFGVRQPEQIRILAKRSEGEWVNLITTKSAAGQVDLPFEVSTIAEQARLPEAEVYGKMLDRQFREAFPTTAFTGGLERALQNGGARGLQHGAALSRFLNQHETFELLNTPVDNYFKDNIHADFQELAADESFRLEVKAVQRVFKLASTFEATNVLLADDLHSAQKIYRMGESEFVRQYSDRLGFTPETATLAWNRAADTHGAVLTIVADLKSLEAESLPIALQNNSAALTTFPNWNNLFQTGDLCACESCRSVLSPAAYFADLLMFLKDRKAKNPANTVKDILFRRRPDLGFLELNCDNALVPLPYVDVVCEVLEAAIDTTNENDLELASFTTLPADPAAAKTVVAVALQAAFSNPANSNKEKIDLGNSFSLTQVTTSDPDRWVVHGDTVTCLLKKKAPLPNFFAEILCNTKAKTDDLRAYPQYVNPKAYEKLRQGKYPMKLPFDLFAEEVRAGFQKTNLQRWDLMQTLRGNAAPNNPTDGDIAAEYFKISISANPTDPSEKTLILVADTTIPGQQTVWGETGANWLSTVSNVKSFLLKTNLEYNEVLALLDLKFINSTGDIFIQHLDSSCDLDKKIIQGLDVTKLDRIHRFLRLWHKLNSWKLWELDLVIRHPSIGNGVLDEPFLINLFYLSRLQDRLGGKTTVEQVCALFGNLNAENHFTQLHEKRQDALYQTLFLNKRLIQPLDLAFEVSKVDVAIPTTEKISGHSPVLLAALGIREADLGVLQGLTKASDGTPYITDDLTLTHLSFLWRHSWLSKLLKFKVNDWKLILKLFQQDLLQFANPQSAWVLVQKIDQLKASGFTPDQLNWVLAGDRTAKSAPQEATVIRFLTTLRKDLQTIKSEYDPGQYPFLTVTPPTDSDRLTALLTSLLQKLNRDEATTQFFIATLRDEASSSTTVLGLPPGFDFPDPIKNSIQIRYDQPTKSLRFTGLMTAAQRTTLLTDASLIAVTGIPAYQEGINQLFANPRLALKFFEPMFTAPLANLPASVDFKALSDAALVSKISYVAEQRVLRFAGIMSQDEQAALNALSTDVSYRNAVSSLATQPGLIVPPSDRIWLLDTDLQFPLRDLAVPTNDHLAINLVTAITKALTYLSKTSLENTVVQETSTQLGLTDAVTRYLLTHYALLPDSLLKHLTGAFTSTMGVVDYTTLKTTFDSWYWANRLASLWTQWQLTLAQLEKITALTPGAQLLDFATLPLDSTGAIASLDRLLRISRLLQLRDRLPETQIALLDVLDKLNAGAYAIPADFAADVEQLNPDWSAINGVALITSLNLAYPADYLLAETWERLQQAFSYLDRLNATANTVKRFAAAAMTLAEATLLKDLLSSKFGTETWLTLSTEIQDVLRERKRDALAAYLLTQPQPADAPSGKWENTNDLYAYYLLDVEMASCLLTSRLVQASGSVQLFVQRCLMGLEPDVVVNANGADGDSAWRWWKWMRKFQVWVANRKVFLWPENWIEPELRKDNSSFFKDLENELLQNDINQDTVEKAFTTYLEKLDGVAQLEIAGFYQEDDGDNAIVHVFGRTAGAEPHIYYYRRYDYRQWTPWEKVELDIQGDYLIPAVVNQRLFLFWPVLTEVPDEPGNSTVKLPTSTDQKNGSFTPDKTQKKLRLQMAISDYRQGKWTPKRISKDFDESAPYAVGIVRKHYYFFPIDRSQVDGRFGIQYGGSSLGSDESEYAYLSGAFEISGCKGIPEKTENLGNFFPVIRPTQDSVGTIPAFLKWVELGQQDEFGQPHSRPDQKNDFTLEDVFSPQSGNFRFAPILLQTPGIFHMTPPWHLSYLDGLLLDGQAIAGSQFNLAFSERSRLAPLGTWLPFFYNDKNRTFFVLPSLGVGSSKGRLANATETIRYYYPGIKKALRQLEDYFEGQIQTWLNTLNLSTLTATQRQQLEQFLAQAFPEANRPPYTDNQVKTLIRRWWMRYFHYYLGAWSLYLFQFRQFHFKNSYHPFVCDFAKLVYNPLKGIPALMSRETQLQNSGFSFRQTYQPTAWVVEPPTETFYPQEVVDFTPDGAYSPYNWELFFHAPLFIANSLSKNQRFEEARDWYHFIFNPIGVESATPGGSLISKYWITKPFFATTDGQYIQQRIDHILRMLSGDTTVPGYSAQARKDLEDQVLDWRTHPFEPHRIANYRTVAYQKTVVMKYLDNLIAWGDNLFQQDSMESINEATQLYILAAEILGPRPKKIPPQAKPPLESFNELETQFDQFSNALVQVENLVPVMAGSGGSGSSSAPLPMLYFCIPPNDKLLGYWDTVSDRLYKIRHCMNIEGVVRQLSLFEPPIDPGALVKAIAGGVDLSSALSDLSAPLPLYRFNVLLQKANEVCNDVKALGGAFLSALEKKDAEAMNLLRQGQEIRLLDAVKALREQQIEEAKETLEGLKKSKITLETRRNYYRDIPRLISGEQLHLNKLDESQSNQEAAQGIKLAASIISILPAIDLGVSGFGGSPIAKFKIGGLELGQAASLASDVLSFMAQIAADAAVMASSKAGFDRRWDDWKLQEKLANQELDQLDPQIAAAALRIVIAEKELENHVIQIENAHAMDEFMRSKYTNQELYQWQIGQISGVYFQSYKLAYDLAKRAERCFRFEIGLQTSSYINFGYWDSLKKGLLAGENLQYDLRRLETAYLEQNRREFELTKHISLTLLDPLALIKLRETGRCFINLPEEIFDLDYPGHYFRRIKSVSLTLPCVAGPYTTISCTLRLLKNSIRINTGNGDNGYPRNTDSEGLPIDDDRWIENAIPVKAIATSSAQNDSGVFELSFQDERYLPFERAGVISQWSLELFNDNSPDFGKALRQFDYSTVTDIILHIKYTAREDAGGFKTSAIAHLQTYFKQDGTTPCLRMFNLKQEFPTQWHRFLNPTNPANGNIFELEMGSNLFSFRDQRKTLKVNTIWFLARCTNPGNYNVTMTPPLPAPPPAGSNTLTLTPINQYGRLHFAQKDVSSSGVAIALTANPSALWQLTMTRPGGGNLQKDELEDAFVVLGYEWV